jgi:hypothetical protein
MPFLDAQADQETADRWDVFARARATLDALEHLFSGLGTVALALVALLCTSRSPHCPWDSSGGCRSRPW